jgi:hypothetical protein
VGRVAPRRRRRHGDEGGQPAPAFVLELGALGALGYWGASTGSRPLTKVLLAVLLVVVYAANRALMAVWDQ